MKEDRESSAGASNYLLAADNLPPACVLICTFPQPCCTSLLQAAYGIEPHKRVSFNFPCFSLYSLISVHNLPIF